MKMKRSLLVAMGLVLSAPALWAQENAATAGLANQLGCMFCHNAEVKLVGPAFKAVAEKYKDQADAVSVLTNKVKNGGAGVWGRVPMPAHSLVPDDQVKSLVGWVLKGAPAK
jgi:cytochrome c